MFSIPGGTPMVVFVLVCLLVTTVSGLFWLATCARNYLRRDSRSTTRSKAPDLPVENTTDLKRRLAALEADQVDLSASLEKTHTTLKRLTSRAGMQELRARRRESSPAPPIGTDKASLLRHYGMAGKVGPEFARAQQQLELSKRNQDTNDEEETWQ